MATWKTVKSAKVVFVPIGTKTTKTGEVKTTFARTGIRIEMEDGSWWFKSFTHNSYSHHWNGLQKPACFNQPMIVVEHKQSFTPTTLAREYGNRPEMLAALAKGEAMAFEAEAEKRLSRAA